MKLKNFRDIEAVGRLELNSSEVSELVRDVDRLIAFHNAWKDRDIANDPFNKGVYAQQAREILSDLLD